MGSNFPTKTFPNQKMMNLTSSSSSSNFPNQKMMNLTQQKLQLIGIYGVFKETVKLISTSTTIFSQITLAFLLPLFLQIFTLFKTPNLWSFNSLLFFSAALFFLLSSAAALFAAASTLAGGPLLRVSPKLCKQLLVTFLCLIMDFLAFNFIVLSAITLICIAISTLLYFESFKFVARILILFVSAEALYFALIWQIASAVSVFEAESYGFEAVARSKELIKGKTTMGLTVLVLISGFPVGVVLFVVRYGVGSVLAELGILGVVWIWWFLVFLLIGCVLYLVCKSFHGESIDELELSVHLQTYLPADREAAEVEDDDDDDKSLV